MLHWESKHILFSEYNVAYTPLELESDCLVLIPSGPSGMQFWTKSLLLNVFTCIMWILVILYPEDFY